MADGQGTTEQRPSKTMPPLQPTQNWVTNPRMESPMISRVHDYGLTETKLA